jgi:hypothetical protein
MQNSEFKFEKIDEDGLQWWQGSAIRTIRLLQLSSLTITLEDGVVDVRQPFTMEFVQRLLSRGASVIGFHFECMCAESRVPDTELRMCARHHAICSTCWKKLYKCPMCNQPYVGVGPLKVIKVIVRPEADAVGFRYRSSPHHVYWSPRNNLLSHEQALLSAYETSRELLAEDWTGELTVITDKLVNGARIIGFQQGGNSGHVYRVDESKFNALERRAYKDYRTSESILMGQYQNIVRDVNYRRISEADLDEIKNFEDGPPQREELMIGSPIDLTFGSFEQLSLDSPPRTRRTTRLAPETPSRASAVMTAREARERASLRQRNALPQPPAPAPSSASNARPTLNRHTRRRITAPPPSAAYISRARDQDNIIWGTLFGDASYRPSPDSDSSPAVAETPTPPVSNVLQSEVGEASQPIDVDEATDDDQTTIAPSSNPSL